jgi:hypothetical protein
MATTTPYSPTVQELSVGEHRELVSGLVYEALGMSGPKLTIKELNAMKVVLRPYADAYRNIPTFLAAAKAALRAEGMYNDKPCPDDAPTCWVCLTRAAVIQALEGTTPCPCEKQPGYHEQAIPPMSGVCS